MLRITKCFNRNVKRAEDCIYLAKKCIHVFSFLRFDPFFYHYFSFPDSRGAVVSYWRKYVHEVQVNRLGDLSLPRKSVVRLTDSPDMTLDVYRGRKTTTQQQQFIIVIFFIVHDYQIEAKFPVSLLYIFFTEIASCEEKRLGLSRKNA